MVGTVFSFLIYYRATMGPRTLISFGERCVGQTRSATLLYNPLSSLTSRIDSSWTGGVLSYLISSIYRFRRLPLGTLHFSHNVFALVFAAAEKAFCKTLVSLESRIFYAAPAVI